MNKKQPPLGPPERNTTFLQLDFSLVKPVPASSSTEQQHSALVVICSDSNRKLTHLGLVQRHIVSSYPRPTESETGGIQLVGCLQLDLISSPCGSDMLKFENHWYTLAEFPNDKQHMAAQNKNCISYFHCRCKFVWLSSFQTGWAEKG